MAKNYPYLLEREKDGVARPMPYLPMTLTNANNKVTVSGLLDTGATVNVMPFEVGMQLGAIWEEQTTPLRLSGNLDNFASRGLIVTAKIDDFEEVRLAFAWTLSNNVPLILGQINFFMNFKVCFFGEHLRFEIEKT